MVVVEREKMVMEVFRFMSKLEFTKFMNGEVLKNTTDHSNGNKTNSKGFCFLNLEEHKPEEAIHFLSGLVNLDYCVKFRTNKELNKTYGIYADSSQDKKILENGIKLDDIFELLLEVINGGKNIQQVKIDEYCTEKYSNQYFELIGYTEPILLFNDPKWSWKK